MSQPVPWDCCFMNLALISSHILPSWHIGQSKTFFMCFNHDCQHTPAWKPLIVLLSSHSHPAMPPMSDWLPCCSQQSWSRSESNTCHHDYASRFSFFRFRWRNQPSKFVLNLHVIHSNQNFSTKSFKPVFVIDFSLLNKFSWGKTAYISYVYLCRIEVKKENMLKYTAISCMMVTMCFVMLNVLTILLFHIISWFVVKVEIIKKVLPTWKFPFHIPRMQH